MKLSIKFMTDMNVLLAPIYWSNYFPQECLNFFNNTYGDAEISYYDALDTIKTIPDISEEERRVWVNAVELLQRNSVAIKYGNRFESLPEYKSIGIDYSEDFTDLDSAKSALANKQTDYYSTAVDGTYFSFAQIVETDSGYAVTPLQSVDDLEPSASIQVYSVKGKWEVVPKSQLEEYLNQEILLAKQEDANFWKVQQKLRDTDDGFTVFETVT
jgi:hypothetical protein